MDEINQKKRKKDKGKKKTQKKKKKKKMCQGRKLRRIICKSCSSASKYEVIGTWEIIKKGYKCKNGKNECIIWNFKDEIESKHRCTICLAKTMLGLKKNNSRNTNDNTNISPSHYYHDYYSGNTVRGGYSGVVPGSSNVKGNEGTNWYDGIYNGGIESSSRWRYASEASLIWVKIETWVKL